MYVNNIKTHGSNSQACTLQALVTTTVIKTCVYLWE